MRCCRSLYGHSHDFMYALWWRKINCAAFIWQAAPTTSERASGRPACTWSVRTEKEAGSERRERKKDSITAHAANSCEQLLDGKSAQPAFSQRPLVWSVFFIQHPPPPPRLAKRTSQNWHTEKSFNQNYAHVKFSLTLCNKLTIITSVTNIRIRA